MNFYAREKELSLLLKQIKSEKTSLSLVFGRRRVGKSELVKQALKNYGGNIVFYECRQTSEEKNAKGISEIFEENFDLPKLAYRGIEELLAYIFKFSEKEKIVLVLDEYPYLRECVKGMDSVLQALIDTYKEKAHLSIILLGSYMKSLLFESNPLYGRVDLFIDLKPMNYYESALFYPNYSSQDKVRIYSVFGGIPYYNSLIDDRKSVRENVIELVSRDHARLENEVIDRLRIELQKINNANEVFDALSKGYKKFSDILSQSYVSSGPTLIDVLDKLMKMELVNKIAPINDENNKRKSSYEISDNLSSFYYRYLFTYASQRKIMDEDVFFQKYIAKDFEEQYVPHQFERIVKEYLIRENKAGRLEPIREKIGKYYYDDPKNRKNGEFDVVSLDEKGYVFYEAKFKERPISAKEIELEIEQVKQTGLDCYQYVFISCSGFEIKERKDCLLIPLDDLYR